MHKQTMRDNSSATKNSGKRKSNLKNIFRRFMKNKAAVAGVIIMVIFALSAIFAPLITKYNYSETDLTAILQRPSAEHWFGTDHLGRDLFSRIIYGGRISLMVGFISVGIGLSLIHI